MKTCFVTAPRVVSGGNTFKKSGNEEKDVHITQLFIKSIGLLVGQNSRCSAQYFLRSSGFFRSVCL